MRMEGVHCWWLFGREGRSTRGDGGHMSHFLSILPQTISCFPNLLKVLKQDRERQKIGKEYMCRWLYVLPKIIHQPQVVKMELTNYSCGR